MPDETIRAYCQRCQSSKDMKIIKNEGMYGDGELIRAACPTCNSHARFVAAAKGVAHAR